MIGFNCFTFHAASFEQTAMQLNHILRTSSLVQLIYILCNNNKIFPFFDESFFTLDYSLMTLE